MLRINRTLSVTEVQVEHGILRRMRQAGLPFQVPEPVAALNGATVVETEAWANPRFVDTLILGSEVDPLGEVNDADGTAIEVLPGVPG
jgi:hypothetical protein